MSKTVIIERNLESEFYKLYNETRLMFVKELEETNNFNRVKAVHYAQLILNRYMFICFAEDVDLLPPQITINSITAPIKSKNVKRNSIWYSLNDLFLDINEGNPEKHIFEYNGGLFEEDIGFIQIRDIVEDKQFFKETQQNWKFEGYSLEIETFVYPYSNKINRIYKNLLTISSFDFSSDLDVNILGHIFENSIGDLEELRSDLLDRRKKEGVFYTPEYITDYICKNTIIPYLSKSNKSNTIKALINEYWGSQIEDLDKKVQEIKIIDPACGSGAFLNKASDILLEIHKAIHKQRYKDKQTLMPYFDNIKKRREILLNNIFGVDLNEESVEITKLSLFLKVCRKDLKLPNLDKNIKCGNSLIDDPQYSDKPFIWKQEFNSIFKAGGFDIVMGNPPYVGEKGNKEIFRNIKKSFLGNFYQGKMDLFYFFFHLSLNIVKNNGQISFITTNYYTTATTGNKLRQDFKNRSTIRKLINFNELKIFESAQGQHNMITFLSKCNSNIKSKNLITKRKGLATPNILEKILSGNDPETNYFEVKQSNLYEGKDAYIRLRGTGDIENDQIQSILNKIKNNGELITKLCDVKTGLRSGIDKISKKHLKIDNSYKLNEEVFFVSNVFSQKVPANEKVLLKPLYKNSDIKRYYNEKITNKFVLYIDRKTDISKFPFVKSHLEKFKPLIEKIRKNDKEPWYSLVRPREERIFKNPKIVIPYRSRYNDFSYNESDFYCSSDVYFIINKKNDETVDLKYILALINSKLYYMWLVDKGKMKGELLELYRKPLTEIRIKQISSLRQKPFIEKVDKLLLLNNELIDEVNSFKEWLQLKFNIEEISKYLEEYYKLDLKELLEELSNKNVKLKSKDIKEIKEEFNSNKSRVIPLRTEIEKIENKIDQMVYDLYNLTKEEIKIVEEFKNIYDDDLDI